MGGYMSGIWEWRSCTLGAGIATVSGCCTCVLCGAFTGQPGCHSNGRSTSLDQNSRKAHHCQPRGFTIWKKHGDEARTIDEKEARTVCINLLTPVSNPLATAVPQTPRTLNLY